ncbi:formylglycine-generating enzyme required for sulfatase activity [Knoellia remsis]|uniref:Formylglycine-generating enzyme required for sulfatase activity n=1 Tax=Knoellia remsis TaxID=407159 RepID=A0A2T0UQJ3_9MICO|nr:formylglycine-generating enzyme family protein [Knoellia remsis]PRY60097.1 formylglycine-generating enzyme required for sulfatase activity [Knoellia remsis]
MSGGSCCGPGRDALGGDGDVSLPEPAASGPEEARGRHTVAQVAVPAGTFAMGDAHGDENVGDGETPVHDVTMSAFEIDAHSLTNDDFARFVEDTGFVTEAERFGYSAVFHLALRARHDEVMQPVPGTPWWMGVRGADWRHPGGSQSDLDGLGDHPVVHVSWNDAVAYCEWAGRRLPTEAQWERAARGGMPSARFPWGDDLLDAAGEWQCNIWQGEFPTRNDETDGFIATAPWDAFSPNGFGAHQMVGNVWEWCADWFNPRTYELRVRSGATTDPTGPKFGQTRVMRGGSYLCHDSYCNRYRNAARTGNTPDSSTGNTGFRTVGMDPF